MGELKKFTKTSLQFFLSSIYENYGFSKQQSELIAEMILLADITGIPSHGVQRLKFYDSQIKSGQIKVENQEKIVTETPISAVIDGQSAMGHLVGKNSMDLAIKKAQISGIGVVTVRNSNHYGIAGYYAKQASESGLIGVSLTNSSAIMVPTNSNEPFVGTNPIAFGMSGVEDRFLFDAATTTVSYGKVELYQKKQLEHPETWTLTDYDSSFANEPTGLAPLGGFKESTGSHKGFGLGLVVEILTAIISEGATADQISENGGICHFFLAINPTLFGDKEAIKTGLDAYLNRIRNSNRLDSEVPVYVPGDKEVIFQKEVETKGISIDDETIAELQTIANQQKLDFPKTIK